MNYDTFDIDIWVFFYHLPVASSFCDGCVGAP